MSGVSHKTRGMYLHSRILHCLNWKSNRSQLVFGIQEDVEEVAEEDVGVVEEDHHSQLEPL